MALFTTRQKQQMIATVAGPLLLVAAVVVFFQKAPFIAWPLVALAVGGLVWLGARRSRRAKAKARPTAKVAEKVPVLADDTVDSLALRFIDVNAKLGRHVSVAEARAISARELARFKKPRATA
ncbi:hypothetical protein [Sinomonas soli]